jgi:hydroxymethylpyrimidine/phosphomethylpyrimidine kinase
MKVRAQQWPSVLTIAGSDSGGCSGIQADLKTFAANHIHGVSVITAITAQNTRHVCRVHALPSVLVREQLDAVFADFRISAIKIGMLANQNIIRSVARTLQNNRSRQVVLDPILRSSSGTLLLSSAAVRVLLLQLLPCVDVLTPNLPEAEQLLGRKIKSLQAARVAARELCDRGAKAVLLKGGHSKKNIVVDVLAQQNGAMDDFAHRRLALSARGTGCVLSSALAARLALGDSLIEATQAATDFVHQSLRQAKQVGLGLKRAML